MKHAGYLLLALIALSATPLLAQVDGKVTGIVSDQDTGQPLVGAQVMIEGTSLGNVTGVDGYYFINQVPVGVQRITSQYLGYETVTSEERILAGQTSSIDFPLPSAVLQVEAIVAVVEREPLVVRDNVVSKSRFTGEDARGLPVDDIDAVVALGAGVYEAQPRGFSGAFEFQADVARSTPGSGYIIRGGRVTESATYLDGVLITDFTSQLNMAGVSTFAVEEADVVTGGFGAEFGHAQSGIVNIVTRAGGTDFHGNLRFTTDGRFGTDGYDVQELEAFEREPCCGYNQLQASLGGPVVPGKLTFFGSLEAVGAADIDPRAAGFNPAMGSFNSSGSTETILPGNRGDRTRLQAKLTSFLTEGSRLTGTYLFARDQLENYNENRGFFQELSERAARLKTYDVILGYDQRVFQTPERNLSLQVRGHYHQTLLHEGTPRNPLSSAAILESSAGAACGAQCLGQDHAFEDDFLNYRFGDIEFYFDDAMPYSVFGLGIGGSRNPDPIFGIKNVWADNGFNDRFSDRNERRYAVRFDLDSQLTRIHRAKAGLEWNWIHLATRRGQLGNTFAIDLTDVEPQVGALYVQDRLDFGDLVIDLGLRWDHWSPHAQVPVLPGLVNCEITRFAAITGCRDDNPPFMDAPTKSVLSPRLGVAHPITDKTQVRLSYGKFHQLPELRHYFQAYLTDNRTALSAPAPGLPTQTGPVYGNPDLDYVKTTAFEVGITHLLSANVVLDMVAYSRDRRGAIRADLYPPGTLDSRLPNDVTVFTNADNGNVKGLDITLAKRFADRWSTDLAWSLQWARGTTSSPFAFLFGGFGARGFDPLNPDQYVAPPTELSAEDFDRLHTISWQLNYRLPRDFHYGSLAGSLFRNLAVYIVYNAHSGEPYTRVNPLSGGFVEDFNSSRLPWFHSGDLRAVRSFDLGTGLQADLFFAIKNFLGIENTIHVHRTSGQPDRGGEEDRNSRSPFIPPQYLEEGATLAYPLALDDVRPEFRTNFSRQDLNGDGTVTLEEGQEALRRALISSNNWPGNYGEPRQIRFGVELRF